MRASAGSGAGAGGVGGGGAAGRGGLAARLQASGHDGAAQATAAAAPPPPPKVRFTHLRLDALHGDGSWIEGSWVCVDGSFRGLSRFCKSGEDQASRVCEIACSGDTPASDQVMTRLFPHAHPRVAQVSTNLSPKEGGLPVEGRAGC